MANAQRSLNRAIVRSPSASYAEGLTNADIGRPDYARALRQHASYCQALEHGGLRLTRLEADDRFPDSTFVEDTAVVVKVLPDDEPRVILTRPGAASRAGEVEIIREPISDFCSQILSIQEPGTLDGGDICEAGRHFFIGISRRTNEAGAEQLAEIFTSYGYTHSFVDIRSEKNILHLKSGVAYLGDGRLAVSTGLAERKEFKGHELLRVGLDEDYAANCMRVNDHILIAAGYPRFEQTLRDCGYQLISLEMTEFQKMDGGLSCLSLRF